MQGNVGLQGTQGTQGNQGQVGQQGSQGHQGTDGNAGGTGYQGTQGNQGLQGGPGSQGYQGHIGQQGPNGNIGATGNQGSQGNQGQSGPQGPQGLQGAYGNQGNQGNQGTQGNQGGPGAQGNQGGVGAQGFQGTLGNQGNQGSTGSQGNQGTGGGTGYQGVEGYQGAQGQPGNAATVMEPYTAVALGHTSGITYTACQAGAQVKLGGTGVTGQWSVSHPTYWTFDANGRIQMSGGLVDQNVKLTAFLCGTATASTTLATAGVGFRVDIYLRRAGVNSMCFSLNIFSTEIKLSTGRSHDNKFRLKTMSAGDYVYAVVNTNSMNIDISYLYVLIECISPGVGY